MKISDAPMDREMFTKEGDKIHCREAVLYDGPFQLAWGVQGGARRVYGFNCTTGIHVDDPDLEVFSKEELEYQNTLDKIREKNFERYAGTYKRLED